MTEPKQAASPVGVGDGTPPLQALRRKLAPALVDAARTGETAAAPGVLYEGRGFFTDPERYSREQNQLFREMSLVARLSSELPADARLPIGRQEIGVQNFDRNMECRVRS
jgi:hypothetical protein